MAKNKFQKPLSITAPSESFISIWTDKLVFWLLLLTVVAIPLYFNIVSFDQFEMPKLTVLRILTCIMCALWGIRIFENGRFEFTPTPLDIPLLGWVIMNIVTTFTSFAPQLSFRGEYENFAGSLSNINYVVLYYIAVQHINNQKRIKIFNYTVLLAGFLITLYALAQFFGFDIIQWNEGSMIKGRYFASMGNPNFLGALLAMMIPVNIAFLAVNFRNKKYLMSGLLFTLFILMYMAMFGTQSRAPFLAFVSSLMVFMVYWLISFYKRISSQPENIGKNSVQLILAESLKHLKPIGIATAVILIALSLSFTVGKEATTRLWNSVTNVKQSMSTSRLHIWIPTLRMIQDNPVLGTGVDTFKSVFPKYEGTNFAQIDGANVSSRTAHNELLNIAATMGIVSLGIYLLLILSYILMWYRSFSRTKDETLKMLSLAMFASFTAYFIQNLFSFGVAAINTYLYMFFAAHAVLYNEFFGRKKYTLKLYDKSTAGMFPVKLVLELVFTALMAFMAYRAYMIYSADVHYNKGKIWGTMQNRWDIAVTEHIKSVEDAPNEVKYYVYLALAYERLAMETKDKTQQLALIHKAVDAYKKGVEINPGNSYYWGNLGRVYTMLGRYEDPKYFQNAIENYQMSIDKAPVTGLFYNNIIELYLSLNMPDKAAPYMVKLDVYDKKLASGSHFMLGNIYFGQKQLNEAEVEYRRSVELDPDNSQAYYNLGVVCAAKKNRDCAVFCLEKFIQMAPSSEMGPNAKNILKSFGVK
jgi:putative inorganic carbon (HCO3(-)) transporter